MKVSLTVLMKRVFLLLITFSSLQVQGQKGNLTEKLKRILIGVNFSPDYNFRTLNNNGGGSSGDLIIKSRNDMEIPKFGYTTGINVFFNSSKHAGLETGVQYSNKGYKTKSQDLVSFPPSSDLPTKVKMTYSYNYIGIPLKAKFTFGKSKLHLTANAGFMTNLLLNVKQISNYQYSGGKMEKKTQSITSGFQKVDISPMIGVGIDYKTGKNFHFIAEPTFRYGAVKTMDAPVTEHLLNAGLNIGIYRQLR